MCEKRLSRLDCAFSLAVKAHLDLYDLTDCDRDFLREEMEWLEERWADVVGEDIAMLDDA